jgi:hypothetical protein
MTIFKNIKYLTLLSFILLVEFSCSDDLPKTKSEQVAEVLEVDTEASELIDFSSRGSWSEYDKPNPIEALFKEALKGCTSECRFFSFMYFALPERST